jgi:hypothetical protein
MKSEMEARQAVAAFRLLQFQYVFPKYDEVCERRGASLAGDEELFRGAAEPPRHGVNTRTQGE